MTKSIRAVGTKILVAMIEEEEEISKAGLILPHKEKSMYARGVIVSIGGSAYNDYRATDFDEFEKEALIIAFRRSFIPLGDFMSSTEGLAWIDIKDVLGVVDEPELQ